MLFFQVIELNNDRLMTNTEYKTLSPEWNKVFQVIKAKIDKKENLDTLLDISGECGCVTQFFNSFT